MISQIVLNRRASILFVIMVGNDLEEMRRVNRSALTSITKGDFKLNHSDLWNSNWGEILHKSLEIECQTTEALWPSRPTTPKSQPIHLVIITHGLFSNLTADMLYLRDALYLLADNVFVAGCRDNAGRTERGIHRLGVNISVCVTNLVDRLFREGYTIDSISFVGHSLGGPVQLYGLKHILLTKGTTYFKDRNIQLKHLVFLVCPILGVLSEISLLISWFLDLGTLGKTGRDLTLLKKLPSFGHGVYPVRPILEELPDEPIETALRNFELLTVYANAVNDGIVPLRTSAILYLDWEGLGDVCQVKTTYQNQVVNGAREAGEAEDIDASDENKADKCDIHDSDFCVSLVHTKNAGPGIGEISDETSSDVSEKYTSFLTRIFGLEVGTAEAAKKKKLTNRLKKYAKISAKGSNSYEKDDDDAADEEERLEEEIDTLNIPPKASAVESALSSLICPMPSRKYILDPLSRSQVIFHDKYYHHDSLPPEQPKNTRGVAKFFSYRDWRVDKQVRIARKYHAPGVTWRKVLVCLPPDAHNNIVVRRRFSNGYGWGVIDHLIENIFQEKILPKPQ